VKDKLNYTVLENVEKIGTWRAMDVGSGELKQTEGENSFLEKLDGDIEKYSFLIWFPVYL
jgi:hypothetical protein